jgi:hypothetical protein
VNRAGLFVFFCVAVACGPIAPPNPPSTETCATACARYRELGCPGAGPTAKGSTCEAACENLESSGVVTWDVGCRARAPTCDAFDACGG